VCVCVCVCVCVLVYLLVTTVSSAKTDRSAVWLLTRGGKEPCIRWGQEWALLTGTYWDMTDHVESGGQVSK